jgi:hypothetical protein
VSDVFEEVIGGILDVSHSLIPDDLPGVIDGAARAFGAAGAQIYLCELEQRYLVLFDPDRDEPTTLDIDGTLAGRAFRTTETAFSEDGMWCSMLDGADRVGVLHVLGPVEDPALVRRLERLASLAAELVVAKSAYGDTIVNTARVRPVTIAAELRWSMLPPLTFENDAVSVAAILEPAYEVAGDSFDYAVSGSCVQLALFDAMGHGLEASRMSNLAMAAYRFARRSSLEIVEQHAMIDRVLNQEFGPDKFTTGQLAQLDLDTGKLSIVSAGHPAPLHLRGTKTIGAIETSRTPPMGLVLGTPTVTEISLEQGDMVLFFTDGVTEARSPAGEQFGVELLSDFLSRAASSGEMAAEMLRRLTHRIVEHVAGSLHDDATLLLLRWKAARPQAQ